MVALAVIRCMTPVLLQVPVPVFHRAVLVQKCGGAGSFW